MKQFRPYHFPPLYQLTSALPKGATGGAGAGSAEEWQAALSDGYRQGQREGYEAGLDQGRSPLIRQGLFFGVVCHRLGLVLRRASARTRKRLSLSGRG